MIPEIFKRTHYQIPNQQLVGSNPTFWVLRICTRRVCPTWGKLYRNSHFGKHFSEKKLRFSGLSQGFKSLLLHQTRFLSLLTPQKAESEAPRKGVDKAQMRFCLALTLVLAATCLSACIPLPVRYHTTPEIYGTVTRNGVPVDGAKVGYSNDMTDAQCDSPVVSHPAPVTSEANGTFHFEGTYSFFHIIYLRPIAADAVNGRICIETSDGQHFSEQLSLTGANNVGSIPSASCDQLIVKCDLANTCSGTAQ